MNTSDINIPHCDITPTERQAEFLRSGELEVFFGGAAGGGKSVALLMAALQHVDKPGYAALIIRKDLPRLGLAGGLIPRSHEWLAGNKEAKWNQVRRQWQFPFDDGPPATITFGYLAHPFDKYRYSSSEFQFIAFDELTDFAEDDYLFLFSRLRRVKTLEVPLRMRSASNPGGIGHLWVKQRFVDPPEQIAGRKYIPSRIADNPYLDEQQYLQSLSHLPTVTRERLMNGDWSVQEKAIFNVEWFRYFLERDGQLELLEPGGRTLATIEDNGSHRRFITIDPAGTSADREEESSGRGACWSVLQVWDQPNVERGRFLILRHQVRERLGSDGLLRAIRQVAAAWKPWQIWIEGERLGHGMVDQLQKELPIRCIPPAGKDKPTRAMNLIVKMELGQVFFPKYNFTWRPQLEAEFLAWTGRKREPADQIDAAAYAAIVAGDALGETIQLCMPLAIG